MNGRWSPSDVLAVVLSALLAAFAVQRAFVADGPAVVAFVGLAVLCGGVTVDLVRTKGPRQR